jgi:hypothetical protein
MSETKMNGDSAGSDFAVTGRLFARSFQSGQSLAYSPVNILRSRPLPTRRLFARPRSLQSCPFCLERRTICARGQAALACPCAVFLPLSGRSASETSEDLPRQTAILSIQNSPFTSPQWHGLRSGPRCHPTFHPSHDSGTSTVYFFWRKLCRNASCWSSSRSPSACGSAAW